MKGIVTRFFSKVLAGFAAVTAAGTAAAVYGSSPPEQEPILITVGDCNGDSVCNSEDITFLQRYLAGAEAEIAYGADIDEDGAITTKDLALLKQRFVPQKQADVTVMVYLSGSNLESNCAEASTDLAEMMQAQYGEHLNVVVMTGGAEQWHTSMVNAQSDYRVILSSSGTVSQALPGEPRDMGAPETLRDFIVQTAADYPADRYALVLWGHGAGPIFGCCFDERSGNTLLLPDLQNALQAAQVHFDWIGFDSCLMGTLETAYAIQDYADYMISSQIVLSGLGWEYSELISKWSAEPNCSVPRLAETVIRATVDANIQENNPAALSCCDLQYTEDLMNAYYDYFDAVYQKYHTEGIRSIAAQRAQMADTGSEDFPDYDTVDLLSCVNTMPVPGLSEAVQELAEQMIICNSVFPEQPFCGLTVWFFKVYPEDGTERMAAAFLPLGIHEKYIAQMQEMSTTFCNVEPEHAVRTEAETAQIDRRIAENINK